MANLGNVTALKFLLSSFSTHPLAIFLSLIAQSKTELQERALPNTGSLLLTLGMKAAFESLVRRKSKIID